MDAASGRAKDRNRRGNTRRPPLTATGNSVTFPTILRQNSERPAISTHEDFERDEEVKGSSDRTFGLVIGAALAVIGLLPLLGSGGPRWWLVAIGGAVAAAGLVAPALLAPFNRLWTRFGLLLNRVTNPIVMALMFFVVLTPSGLLMRLFGKDPLRRRFDADAATYWIEREPPGPTGESMRNQF